jgi:serine/threonine protein kinase
MHNDAMNSPEGFHSIITDYCYYGSLKGMIDGVGSLPESIVKLVTMNILKSLDNYSKTTKLAYGCISPNNIMFDSEFNIKV